MASVLPSPLSATVMPNRSYCASASDGLVRDLFAGRVGVVPCRPRGSPRPGSGWSGRSATGGRRARRAACGTPSASAVLVAGRGRRPEGAAQVVGGEQVLDRQVVLLGELGELAARASASRRAATGSFSAQARGSGGPSPRGARVGRSASGSSRASVERGDPAAGVALGAAAVEALGGEQRRLVGRHRRGGGDDRGVGEDPARGDVALARRSRRGSPTGRGRRPGRGGRGPGAGRTYGATPRRAGWARSRAGASNSWRAHSSLPAASSSAASASRSSTSTSTSRAAYSSHGSGSGRVDQSTAECSLAQPVAEQRLDQGGQADPRVAEQPAGELGVEQRASGRARPRPGRAGPGWRRAGSTRCRRAPPAAAPATSNAIGSTRAVPAPSRRSWIR